jgi:5-methylcytosine-specific restriction enzyme A
MLLPKVHRRQREDTRPSARGRGYDTKWERYSKSFLLTHPWCSDPLRRHPGQRIRATVTDHIVAHKLSQAIASNDAARIQEAMLLFWSASNHGAVCGACNAAKNIALEGGFGNARKKGGGSLKS